MADCYTQFSTVFPIGSAANTAPALALYRQLADELAEAGETIGFAADEGGPPEAPHLWLYSDDNGDPEHVITFAIRCATALNLVGHWGFVWGLGCSRPCLDGFGGGAHVLDLGRRKTVAWLDCETWLVGQLAIEDGPRPQPATLLHDAATREGWTRATELAVLLDFIDALVTDDPGVADRLQAHLATTSAELGEMRCRECGELMVIAAEGTSHHVGRGMDGIDHGRDRDHVAIADGEG